MLARLPASDLLERKIPFTFAPKTSTAPIIDGNLDDDVWAGATKITNFVLTAGDAGQPAKHQTEAYLLYDDTHLYVAFRCWEPDIKNLKITSKQFDSEDILYDDRVEVFLDINHDHRSFYELAVNPNGVQFDQREYNRLHGSKTCDMFPEWNARWRAKTKIGQDQWCAEIQIDVTTFGVEKLTTGTTWGLNLARVRQPDVVKGDEFFKREPAGPAEYSAWAPVADYIRETISNFHAPVEFGDLVFGDPGFEVKAVRLRSALYAFGPLGYPSLFGNNPLEIDVVPGATREAIAELTVEPETVDKWQKSEKVAFKAGEPVKLTYYIPENLDNKIVLRFLDPESGKQLYRTCYIEMAPPFIEFNLEALYSRDMDPVEPVQFKLLTDPETLSKSTLKMEFKNPRTGQVIQTASFDNLESAAELQPVFDVEELRKLPGGNYKIDCTLMDKAGKQTAFFSQNLTKFNLEIPKKFAAYEGEYSYGGITNHAIWVEFPFPAKFVFWRSASYIPIWDCDQAAMTNEFIECWGGGNQGCNEPMQDRECRYSSTRIVENSPARVVVHWRYALSDPHYKIYNNEWVDEYYTLYPDGVGIREVNLWPNSNTRHEMMEVILVRPPGIQTMQLYDKEFATLSTLDGRSHSNMEFKENNKMYKDFLKSADDFIIEVHFKNRMHPFTVFSFRDELLPGVTKDHPTVISKDLSTADRRGHWPASRYQIDGYNTVGLDVPNHGNIGNIQADVDSKYQPMTWTFLIGIKEDGEDKDKKFARSWLYPAEVKVESPGVAYKGFDESQRAYLLKTDEYAGQIIASFSSQEAITNPVFVLENPGALLGKVLLNGKNVNVKSGQDKEGNTVVFLQGDYKGKNQITFTFEKSGKLSLKY